MKPTLHTRYAWKDAIACFHQSAGIKHMGDRGFVLLQDVVLYFANMDHSKEEPHFLSPSDFTWRPEAATKHPFDERAWLPFDGIAPWDTSQPSRHHLFVKDPGTTQYVYLGPAHLEIHTKSITRGQFRYRLEHKLSHDLWRHFGGGPSWNVNVNGSVYSIAQGDQYTLNRAMGHIYERNFFYLILTRDDEEQLHLHTNQERGWLMYRRSSDDSERCVLSNESDQAEAFRCTCGIPQEYPRSATLEKRNSIKVLHEFFTTGRLPTHVSWTASMSRPTGVTQTDSIHTPARQTSYPMRGTCTRCGRFDFAGVYSEDENAMYCQRCFRIAKDERI